MGWVLIVFGALLVEESFFGGAGCVVYDSYECELEDVFE